MKQPPSYRPIMVAGTGSHVGKSVVTMGLCRWLKRRGVDVAPFKAQNMALNSGITPEGLEIGRAQVAQAQAAGLEPSVDMNPILLKPGGQTNSQVVLMGKPMGNFAGADYYALKPKLLKTVLDAFDRLSAAHQVVVMEGAGSCAEVNLKKNDLVNLPLAQRVGAKVLLVADIDTGGVFAQVLGTLSLMTPAERASVGGVIVNKFRGDPALFSEGMDYIAEQGQVPVLGLLPRFEHILLPQEDGVALERGELAGRAGSVRVGGARLSHISNYTDFDALAATEGVELSWLERPEELAGLDLLVLPGTKNTLAALAKLRASGLDQAIRAFHSLGGKVLGLCGGYQLLGQSIADPDGVEGRPGSEPGLGLLAIATTMAGDKTTTRVKARSAPGLPFAAPGELKGYEIHMGLSRPLGTDRPAFRLASVLGKTVEQDEGQVSPDGRVVGTYLHGILDNDALRAALLAWARGRDAPLSGDYAAFRERQFDLLADHLEAHLDLSGLLEPRAPSE
ncbi:MAG: cobyric acid synthase [Desulfarculaceae bacterium]|nr:cobyric acid synthase [Desulfarculaceae bacterium]MCF8071332.1 cobyric acid synthase [Desulfarculaceae bacterium]MCF8101657.1 cobyric acid synthase [Desulfarculaceae bacterium]MCF8116734.1 cobyric acid synthase [Desulfarculaceae bacterium]